MANNFFEVMSLNVARHAGRTQVIKIGGEVVEDDASIRNLVRQTIALANFGANVIVVHGGGVQITKALEQAGIKAEFVNGIRNTSEEAVGVTQMCLAELNDKIVRIFDEEVKALDAEVSARGFGGYQDGIIEAKPVFEGTRTGTVSAIDAAKLHDRFVGPTVQFIYPVCRGEDGGYMNVNADDVAAAVAIAMDADRLIICSNIPGVMDKDKKVISKIETGQIAALVEDGTVSGGMIPKLKSASDVILNSRVGGVVILNGKDSSAIERELFTEEGGGTLIVKGSEPHAPFAALDRTLSK